MICSGWCSVWSHCMHALRKLTAQKLLYPAPPPPALNCHPCWGQQPKPLLVYAGVRCAVPLGCNICCLPRGETASARWSACAGLGRSPAAKAQGSHAEEAVCAPAAISASDTAFSCSHPTMRRA
eukprot:364265-Chlamydomonas_euryale.AAC.20